MTSKSPGRRRAGVSRPRRFAQIALATGAGLSLAAAVAAVVGPEGFLLAGIGVALATAVLVVVLGRRELAEARADYRARSNLRSADHHEALARIGRQTAQRVADSEQLIRELTIENHELRSRLEAVEPRASRDQDQPAEVIMLPRRRDIATAAGQ